MYSRDDVCTVTDAFLIPIPPSYCRLSIGETTEIFFRQLISRRVWSCSLSSSSASNVIGSRDEKKVVDDDNHDEAADRQGGELADGIAHGRGGGPNAFDRACLSCHRCCGPCYICSSRFQLALLSAIGFCISFGIRCNFLQMTSAATRYAVGPLLPGHSVTVEEVSFVHHFSTISEM